MYPSGYQRQQYPLNSVSDRKGLSHSRAISSDEDIFSSGYEPDDDEAASLNSPKRRVLSDPFPAPHSYYSIYRHGKCHCRYARDRMVLDPKYTNHVDYGTIHSGGVDRVNRHQDHHQQFNDSSHALLSPREDVDDPPPQNNTKMTQGDLYQRQPLLPTPIKDKRTYGNHSEPYYDEDEEEETHHHHQESMSSHIPEDKDVVKIPIPVPKRKEPNLPKEKWKTVLALIIMGFNFIFTLISLSLVHDRLPDRKYGPLPDTFLDTVPAVDWALDVSEYLIMISMNSALLVLVFHKHRFIVFRRVFLLLSLLYLMRGVTMYITVLPVSSRTYYCSPKANQTSIYLVTTRVAQLISGFGLSVNGKHTYCGDYIYSGHTVMLVLSYLIISEYTPKKFYPLHWLSFCMSSVGVVMVLLAHGHYTVDVVIAYYVTTRLFWVYHTLANNMQLKTYSPHNYLTRAWWFPIFKYFEGNVRTPVPREYNWPLPWPRRFHTKSRES